MTGITNFTDFHDNIICGYEGYDQARVSQKMDAKTTFKTKTKTSVWGPANPISTSDAGGRSVPFAQFVKDLLEFKVTGGASWRELGAWALQCAENSTKTALHPEPLIVHLLDQKEGHLEFLAHHDNDSGTLCVCVCVCVCVCMCINKFACVRRRVRHSS